MEGEFDKRPAALFRALRTSPRRWLGVLMLAAAATAIPGNGSERALDAHECFVARSATEMLRERDWVLPRFNGATRLQKPPLNYWAAMGVHELAGGSAVEPVGEWDARAASILSAVALVALAYAWAKSWSGDTAVAWLAGMLLAMSNGYLRWSHSAQPEMTYAASCALALLGFWRARAAALAGRSTLRSAALGWLGVALAVLSKGPLLPAFLLLGWIVGERCEERGVSLKRTLRPVLGSAIVLALCAPWVALIAMRSPEAFAFWRSQMFDRTGGVHGAWWRPFELFYVAALAKSTAPWSLLGLWALIWPWRASGRRTEGARLLWSLAVVPLVALSFSATPKGYYMLPVLAPLSLLGAGGLAAMLERSAAGPQARTWLVRGIRVHVLALVLGVALFTGALLLNGRSPWSEPWVFVLLWLAGACALEAWSGRLGPLLAAGALLAPALALAGLEFSQRRDLDRSLALRVATAAPEPRPLLVTDANAQVLVHYANRCVEYVARAELVERIEREPQALVLTPSSNWNSLGIAGRVLFEAPGHDQLFVLAEPQLHFGAH